MSDVFQQTYSEAYDLLYHEKSYRVECDTIEDCFRKFGADKVHSILDLGCGTGSHAIDLAARGYEVVGVDRSEEMLKRAWVKAAGLDGKGPDFQLGDIRDIKLGRQFDSVIIMFAVLGYQLSNADVLAVLKSSRAHLTRGGLLIFDVWYGPAVINVRPSERFKVIPIPEGELLRLAKGELDVRNHLCTINYHLWRLSAKNLTAESIEVHRMRYFFPLELELFLDQCGFTLLRLGSFPEFNHDPDESSWNVLAVARAV